MRYYPVMHIRRAVTRHNPGMTVSLPATDEGAPAVFEANNDNRRVPWTSFLKFAWYHAIVQL